MNIKHICTSQQQVWMHAIYTWHTHSSKQVIWIPYNAYTTHMHKQTKYWIKAKCILHTHTSKQVIWMPYNAHTTHMHNKTTTIYARHIYMTYTYEQTSDMNAIQCTFNTWASKHKVWMHAIYIWHTHTRKQVI